MRIDVDHDGARSRRSSTASVIGAGRIAATRLPETVPAPALAGGDAGRIAIGGVGPGARQLVGAVQADVTLLRYA